MKSLVILSVLLFGATAQATEVCFIKAFKASARAHLHLTCSGKAVQKIVDGVYYNDVNLTKKKADLIRVLIKRGYRVESENMFIKY